jgi:hypothetical protein
MSCGGREKKRKTFKQMSNTFEQRGHQANYLMSIVSVEDTFHLLVTIWFFSFCQNIYCSLIDVPTARTASVTFLANWEVFLFVESKSIKLACLLGYNILQNKFHFYFKFPVFRDFRCKIVLFPFRLIQFQIVLQLMMRKI